MNSIDVSPDRLLEIDPYLKPYHEALTRRLINHRTVEAQLLAPGTDLTAFALGHEYFGLHREKDTWVFREWAPNATAVYIIGEMTAWRELPAFALERIGANGVWEIRLPPGAFWHKALYRLKIYWKGGGGDRIPAYARRVLQDPDSLIFNAQVWHPAAPYVWQSAVQTVPRRSIYVYEAHVGMAQEALKIGTYLEFKDQILPRIVDAGYDTLQLMALQEHPYYGSFGYHVSNFFAASSRFGTPENLKALIDAAHAAGLAVIMDLVHSHAVSNQVEGISCQDGTLYQYFHDGPRGFHHAWDSRCFNYAKPEVLHFLLSNCRFWLDEYRVDGFRFDGVTSMLYTHHGLEKAFVSYNDYFNSSVDEDALTYLWLANKLIHELRPEAITIAEDISGMPGLAFPIRDGGIGFDYRFAMGVPDYWIRLVKDTQDEQWPMGALWYELTNRRPGEKTISYAESHDQALVGDQTLAFRLMGADMYDHMHLDDRHINIERGMALHKLIRLITLASAGSGYLNFMGNEFGHPDWIDFPRRENAWSYQYARRQWHLADDPHLKYAALQRFDRKMIALLKTNDLLETQKIALLHEHSEDKIIAFQRKGLLFVFNFHPTRSFSDYRINAPAGKYRMIFDSDRNEYGGHGRLTPDQIHFTLSDRMGGRENEALSLYLPNRTAVILKRVDACRDHVA
ncbi:MAG: alpha amylase C-terminal domain-containing protein [Deltaproteobacteria bacterium]|nr:alpha amylase C-terminal domain-containing protein [Deltaproteobacteria bacterium]